jgi:predicted dehydrogenase
VGLGFIGKVHAHGYLNLPLFYDPLPLRARITHVCTSRPETAEAGRRLIEADVATTDYREITENPDIDIVHICTPNHLHKDELLSAMAHGKHIYCDKPLVSDVTEAAAIRDAIADYKGTAQMTFQIRFFSVIMKARQLIEEGCLGEVLQFRCAFLHGGSADPNAPLKWKLSAAAGGGVIADLGSHALDLMHHLLGDYEALSAATKTAYPERPSAADPAAREQVDAEDLLVVLARMRNGALGTIEATKLASGTEDEMRFEIHGSKGALRYNQMEPHHLEFFDATASKQPMGGLQGWTKIAVGQRYPEPANQFPGAKLTIGWIRSHMACLASFLYAVAAGKPGNPGLTQGIYVQELMGACRQSAESGEWVSVPG